MSTGNTLTLGTLGGGRRRPNTLAVRRTAEMSESELMQIKLNQLIYDRKLSGGVGVSDKLDAQIRSLREALKSMK